MALLMKCSKRNPSQKGQSTNAFENFHIQLHKCVLKVLKRPIIWEPSLIPFEITHDIQLCHACIYKSPHL
jgi:hypothetical protein